MSFNQSTILRQFKPRKEKSEFFFSTSNIFVFEHHYFFGGVFF